jgi:tetratricopeptide (TPR) repeat protein
VPARLAALALFLFAVPAGALEGHRANALFEEGQIDEAVAAYREGLLRSEGEVGAVRAGLFNNLGTALYEQEDFAAAQTAFEQSLGVALAAEDRARAAFNAGNAAAEQQNFEAALGFYRRALLARPDFPEAAFNYEYLKRQRQDERPQDSESDDLQPSPFAERLKAEADSLVAAERYRDALDVMQRGLATDSTVQAYGDFVGRLGAVVEIDESDQP